MALSQLARFHPNSSWVRIRLSGQSGACPEAPSASSFSFSVNCSFCLVCCAFFLSCCSLYFSLHCSPSPFLPFLRSLFIYFLSFSLTFFLRVLISSVLSFCLSFILPLLPPFILVLFFLVAFASCSLAFSFVLCSFLVFFFASVFVALFLRVFLSLSFFPSRLLLRGTTRNPLLLCLLFCFS